jgi:hypothetical protein
MNWTTNGKTKLIHVLTLMSRLLYNEITNVGPPKGASKL